MMNPKSIADYQEIKDYVPEGLISLMDIGCGPAYCPMLIARDRNTLKDIHILDGHQRGPKVMGFNKRGTEPWKDVLWAQNKLKLHTKCNIHVYFPEDDQFPEVDLYMSLKSWGHHYPTSVYLERVLDVAKPGTTLIIDLRRRQDGRDLLGDYFILEEENIGRDRKCARTVWLRK